MFRSQFNTFANLFIICLAIHTVLFTVSSFGEIFDHLVYQHPNYDSNHEHCQTFAYLLALFMGWYTLIISVIILTKDAQQNWTFSLLGVPNIVTFVLTFIILSSLYIMFDYHDKHVFGALIEIGCAILLTFITYFYRKLEVNTKLDEHYVKNWLIVLGFPLGAFVYIAVAWHVDHHRYVAIGTGISYILTLVTLEKYKIAKVIKDM